MLIPTTTTRMTEEEAYTTVGNDNAGLLGDFFNRLGHVPKETEVLSVRKFYYPYYCAGVIMHFKRVGKLPERAVPATAVMEGGFGTAQEMKGWPAIRMEEVLPSQVVVCPYDVEQTIQIINKYLSKRAFRKYKSFPDVEYRKFHVLYKPHYACLCRKGDKQFVRVIDAEVRDRNFMLDIKFKELRFMDKNRKDDRIDKRMYFEPTEEENPED